MLSNMDTYTHRIKETKQKPNLNSNQKIKKKKKASEKAEISQD